MKTNNGSVANHDEDEGTVLQCEVAPRHVHRALSPSGRRKKLLLDGGPEDIFDGTKEYERRGTMARSAAKNFDFCTR